MPDWCDNVLLIRGKVGLDFPEACLYTYNDGAPMQLSFRIPYRCPNQSIVIKPVLEVMGSKGDPRNSRFLLK